MALYLLNGEKIPVEFQSEDPQVPSYPTLPGSKLLSYQQPYLNLLTKEITAEQFTIRYNTFSFLKNQAIESHSSKSGLHSRAMLLSDAHYLIDGVGTVHQKQDTVLMLWSESIKCTALFEEGKQYEALDIHASPGLIDQLASFFPEISRLNETEGLKQLLPNPCFISPRVKDIINQILDCPYDESTSAFYFDLKVREYFYVLLEQHEHASQHKHHFSTYEAEQIYKAREILLADLTRPPLTIRQLSRKVALNEFKLKTGFKHFFSIGVFECFQRARMERAKILLLTTTKPIKEISVLSGYPRMTNFITAFRKHFGYTPASLRRSG